MLAEVTKEDAGPKLVLEIGAGAGNTAFPVLAENKNPQLKIHACDYSKTAVEVIRKNEAYNTDLSRLTYGTSPVIAYRLDSKKAP